MAEKLKPYDLVIVGAGIAGCALAHGLATVASGSRSKPLRIALVERSFAEPDRIVGELLQPGGVEALRKLGMEDCLEGIGAVPVYGYCVVHDGKKVHIPYPEGKEGRSFHHGRFIQALRAKALKDPGVEGVEASVSQLVKCEASGRVIGVRATRRGADEKEVILGDLVLVADGCFSSFRAEVLGEAYRKPLVRSYFVGAILNDARLPIDKHGTVALVKGSGPVLLYQIDEHDTRILVDVREPLPSDLKVRALEANSEIIFSNLFTKDAYSGKHHARPTRIPSSSYPTSNREGPTTTYAKLFHAPSQTGCGTNQGRSGIGRRLLEYAPSSYWRRNDRRAT